MGKFHAEATVGDASSIGDAECEDELLRHIKAIAESLRNLYDMAYDAYLPLVDDICSREASESEVGHLLDYLFDFAGEDRMLLLYKRVCRKYFYQYPKTVANHIYMWRDWYDADYEEQQ